MFVPYFQLEAGAAAGAAGVAAAGAGAGWGGSRVEVELRQVALSPIQSQDQTTPYHLEAILLRCINYQIGCAKFYLYSDVLSSMYSQLF